MKLKSILLLRLIYFISFIPRHKYLLILVRNIPNHYAKNKILKSIDPNSVRRLRNINFKNKYIKVEILSSLIIIDLNDHNGFITYINGKFVF